LQRDWHGADYGSGVANHAAFVANANLTVTGCTFSNNSAVRAGGGIYNDGGGSGNATLNVTNSSFIVNSGNTYGGVASSIPVSMVTPFALCKAIPSPSIVALPAETAMEGDL
jgi:predicted outer membrane repeat protein